MLVHISDSWDPPTSSGWSPPVSITPRASAASVAAPRPAPTRVEGRPARISDMRQVEPLINVFARKNLMLPKTHDQLARLFREFVVAEDQDGTIVGCAALRVYTESLAEVASVAVDERAHGMGIGRRLVEGVMEEARELGLKTVFALTLQEDFFHKLGFHTVSKEMFPLKVWADCRNCPKLHACDEIAVAREV